MVTKYIKKKEKGMPSDPEFPQISEPDEKGYRMLSEVQVILVCS